METSTYNIEGMTCQSCVKTITERVSAIKGVAGAKVSLENKRVEITTNQKISLAQVSAALADLPKYTVRNLKADAIKTQTDVSSLKTYKPLITIFTFILLVSMAYQVSLDSFNSYLFMNHIMAGFFIGLSFFKFLDLKAFAESFSSYDPLAQRWLSYGYIYPFIELLLGLLFIAGKFLFIANAATFIILTLTTYGVYKRLQSKSAFQCACLGTSFNLPLSNVTIVENLIMVFMSLYSINSLLKII